MKSFKYFKSGFTIIEIVMTLFASFIIMLTVGLLVASGQKSWTKINSKTSSDSHIGAMNTLAALGAFGRKANRMDYRLYKFDGARYLQVLPTEDPEEIVIGDAVEFRYWDSTFEDAFVDSQKTATSYALFYQEDGDLKIDYGNYPPSPINAAGTKMPNEANAAKTVTLIRNIAGVEFSHTTRNMSGDGKGCIRMKLTTIDPETGESKVILAATLMRNVWP